VSQRYAKRSDGTLEKILIIGKITAEKPKEQAFIVPTWLMVNILRTAGVIACAMCDGEACTPYVKLLRTECSIHPSCFRADTPGPWGVGVWNLEARSKHLANETHHQDCMKAII
jgi:hypothetical protein